MELSNKELRTLLQLGCYAISESCSSGKDALEDKQLLNRIAEHLGDPPIYSPKGNRVFYHVVWTVEECIAMADEGEDED